MRNLGQKGHSSAESSNPPGTVTTSSKTGGCAAELGVRRGRDGFTVSGFPLPAVAPPASAALARRVTLVPKQQWARNSVAAVGCSDWFGLHTPP